MVVLPVFLLSKSVENLTYGSSIYVTVRDIASLASSQFPTAHKHALVTPILKKPSLDPAQLNNYRPISNLSFLSKLLERSVASQISSYFSTNDLFPPLQSAYRPRHSTETALLKITNDALTAADQGMVNSVECC